MALPNAPITLTYGQWKKISNPGQNGTAWQNTVGPDGSSTVIVSHTDTVQTGGSPVGDNIPWGSALGLVESVGKLLKSDGSVSPPLSADNGNDIYYATLLDVGETCEIISDFA